MAKIRLTKTADGKAVIRTPASISWVKLPMQYRTGVDISDKEAVKQAFRKLAKNVQLVPTSARKEVRELAKGDSEWMSGK